jgi:hypothetical protein
MFFLSSCRRIIRQLFGFDPDRKARISRGEPHPVCANGNGIWIGYWEGEPLVFLVAGGERFTKPLAVIFAPENGRDGLRREDYRTACRIAAGSTETFCGVDLRGVGVHKLLLVLDDVTFYPTDKRGRFRRDCEHFGMTYFVENGRLAASVSLFPGRHIRGHQNLDGIPIFEMQIDEWQKAPEGLSEFLGVDEKVKPNPKREAETIEDGALTVSASAA